MFGIVSVPDLKPTPAWIAFSTARGLYWKRYTRRMRSGGETMFGSAHPHTLRYIEVKQKRLKEEES